MSRPYDNAIYSLLGKKFIEKLCTICFPLFVFVYCLSHDFAVFFCSGNDIAICLLEIALLIFFI